MSINQEPKLVVILRWFIYAAAFVPLIIFSDYISPFHFGKVVVFRSLVELMAVIYILLVWKDRSYFPKINAIGLSFLSFALAFSVTTFTSIIPYSSLWGSLERMGGLVTFWHYFVYFIILTAVFRDEKDWMNLFKIMIGVGVLSAIYGFGQRTEIEFFVGSGGRLRIFGTIGNPALFAGYQIVCLFTALMMFFRSGNTSGWKTYYGLSFATMTVAVLMTAVRGSVLAIGIGFLVFALLYSSAYRSKKAKKLLLALVALLVVFVSLAMFLKNTDFVQNSGYLKRVTNFSLNDYTVQTRFWAWQAGFKGWKESFKTIVFGWGPENFNIPFSKHFNPKFFRGPGSETLFDRAHNMFVEVLVTMGLLGFLAYVSIFIVAIKNLWKKLNASKDEILYGVSLISLLIAYAIHNSFIFDTSANFLVFFSVLGFISFISWPKTQQTNKPSHKLKVNQGLWSLTAIALFVGVIIMIYYVNVQPSKANYTTTRAIVAGWANDFPGAMAKYEEAVSYNVPGKYEIRNRFAQYVLEKTGSGKLTPEYIDAIHKAITEVNKNVEENKVDYLPYLYIARLYIILGKDDPNSEYNDKSLEYSLKALDLAPDFVRTYYEIAQAYLNKKDLDNAAKYFKRATELNPEVGVSNWYWGIVEIERGNTNLGLEIVEKVINSEVYSPSPNDIGRLADIYIKKNDFGKVVWAYEMLVKSSPDNAQYKATLAVAYARIGKIDKAVEQAHEAAKLDPKFESEARSFVQQMGQQW